MAYPIAHLLATLPMKYSNLLMICVLLPFWTSLLVRTASWMILLQQQGIVNDFFVWTGLVADDNRPEMMYNKTGTYVAMTQILLPFMVLPLYSVMKTISPSLMRAGKSLGATPAVAFFKVYFPLNNSRNRCRLSISIYFSNWILYYASTCWRCIWNTY